MEYKNESLGRERYDREDEGTPIDLTERVMVIATKEAPYHKEGDEVWCSPSVADKMLKQKWAKRP